MGKRPKNDKIRIGISRINLGRRAGMASTAEGGRGQGMVSGGAPALAPRARQKRCAIGGHSAAGKRGQTMGNCTIGKPLFSCCPQNTASANKKRRRSRYRCAEAEGREAQRRSRRAVPQGRPKRRPRSTDNATARAPCWGARTRPEDARHNHDQTDQPR